MGKHSSKEACEEAKRLTIAGQMTPKEIAAWTGVHVNTARAMAALHKKGGLMTESDEAKIKAGMCVSRPATPEERTKYGIVGKPQEMKIDPVIVDPEIKELDPEDVLKAIEEAPIPDVSIEELPVEPLPSTILQSISQDPGRPFRSHDMKKPSLPKTTTGKSVVKGPDVLPASFAISSSRFKFAVNSLSPEDFPELAKRIKDSLDALMVKEIYLVIGTPDLAPYNTEGPHDRRS